MHIKSKKKFLFKSLNKKKVFSQQNSITLFFIYVPRGT